MNNAIRVVYMISPIGLIHGMLSNSCMSIIIYLGWVAINLRNDLLCNLNRRR